MRIKYCLKKYPLKNYFNLKKNNKINIGLLFEALIYLQNLNNILN